MFIYYRIAVFLAPFFLLTTIVFFLMCLYRGELILGLQAELLKNKDQVIKITLDTKTIANNVGKEYEESKVKRVQEKEVIIKEVERLVDNPVYRNICFDDDGLQQINNHINSYNNPSSSPRGMSSIEGAE